MCASLPARSLRTTHPLWMWLYFGVSGAIGAVLITLIAWQWIQYNALAQGVQRSAAKWSMFGYVFLFTAATLA